MMMSEREKILQRIRSESIARLKEKGVDIDRIRREHSPEDKFTTKKGDYKLIDPKTGKIIFE